MRKNLRRCSIAELGQALRTGRLSCVALVESVLSNIKAQNPYHKAFILILEDRALKEAMKAQAELDNGLDRGPLHGIPYAVKGIFEVEGVANTAGMDYSFEHIALSDAASITLLKEAGAVLVGITNTSPLAATILGINHVFGTPHNPWKSAAYIPGGSSSGAAVAVSAGMVPFALGSDTGGSIRVPASLCGVVGFKPTKGWLSTKGVWPLAPSLDTIGLIGRTVEDVKMVYSCLHNKNTGNGSLKNDAQIHKTAQQKPVNHDIRIGCCSTIFLDDTEPEVITALEKSIKILSNLVFTEPILAALKPRVSTIEIPAIRALRKMMKETSFIASEAYPLHQRIIEDPNIDWVLNWLQSAAKHSKEDTLNIKKQYRKIAKQLSLSQYDLEILVVPATPIPATLLADCDAPTPHAQLSAIYSRNTLMANLAGWCSISVPCGLTKDGLPIGLMLCADAQNEALLISVAAAFEQASGYQSMVPSTKTYLTSGNTFQ
ncbi:hypothetical protein AY601_1809 [Pedobacter cryoconitis]|uniref:Amidase domain-containing protein n=1 Tax=Pedobacter cryoconitis TaxID=188932 RepID=A0A127VCL7_9SPHI|nr:amidase [Pedobacter cryoconitis]AMP98718.1 hypothetical protein AY601_1809 [Pedobacter cryoconitis]